MKAPITDRTLGISVSDASDTKFADVRMRAQDEYANRGKKRKKDKAVLIPDYKIGDMVVMASGYPDNQRYYTLFEVVDFELRYGKAFMYYGIVLKTTTKKNRDRIGRLCVTGISWLSQKLMRYEPEHDKYKWVEEKS